ncbi:hypothetical protein GIB67_015964 [Kingdonia uniflora]|uniref:TF-B3 domain-containing protein n=1 Tax=Kingdonia uniflora TaxID=39325 RepID=A0A7J7PCE3_9MAGN|nr:hypothetical protein GIB67_015964 [Kingdonia uniflora]
MSVVQNSSYKLKSSNKLVGYSSMRQPKLSPFVGNHVPPITLLVSLLQQHEYKRIDTVLEHSTNKTPKRDVYHLYKRIPPSFNKHFNGISLPQKLYIRSPTGKSWTVILKKVDDDLFNRNGWQAFMSDHSLKAGEFLVFKYCGNSKFNVKIYDRTCCEKVLLEKKTRD